MVQVSDGSLVHVAHIKNQEFFENYFKIKAVIDVNSFLMKIEFPIPPSMVSVFEMSSYISTIIRSLVHLFHNFVL